MILGVATSSSRTPEKLRPDRSMLIARHGVDAERISYDWVDRSSSDIVGLREEFGYSSSASTSELEFHFSHHRRSEFGEASSVGSFSQIFQSISELVIGRGHV